MSEPEALDIQIEVSLEEPDIQIGFDPETPDIQFEIDTDGHNNPPYEGEYVAVSDLHDPVRLRTKGLAMRDDVIVQPIPFYEVSNPAGGMTITIGSITE